MRLFFFSPPKDLCCSLLCLWNWLLMQLSSKQLYLEVLEVISLVELLMSQSWKGFKHSAWWSYCQSSLLSHPKVLQWSEIHALFGARTRKFDIFDNFKTECQTKFCCIASWAWFLITFFFCSTCIVIVHFICKDITLQISNQSFIAFNKEFRFVIMHRS